MAACHSTTPAKEEFLYSIVYESATILFEEDTLLSYCKNGLLSENQTKWVLYFSLKGLNISEIAELEQVSVSAVKAWRAGAKEKLRNSECNFR